MSDAHAGGSPRRIALLGGLAPGSGAAVPSTLTLSEALGVVCPPIDRVLVALTDARQHRSKPSGVRFEIDAGDRSSFRRAADFLNALGAEVACLQYDEMMHGARTGSHVLALLRELRMPLVTTLGPVLPRPTLPERMVLEEVFRLSRRVLVGSERSVHLLCSLYDTPREKIVLLSPTLLPREVAPTSAPRAVEAYEPREAPRSLSASGGSSDSKLRLLGELEEPARGPRSSEETALLPLLAARLLEVFEEARSEQALARRVTYEARALAEGPQPLPPLDLHHLRTLCDDTGLLRRASFSIPHYRSGYRLEDNARALLLTVVLEDEGPEPRGRGVVRELSTRLLAFVEHAFDEDAGLFRDVLGFDRRWEPGWGSEESHCAALWALGAVVGRSRDPGRQGLAHELFEHALPAVQRFSSLRSCALALLGIGEYLGAFRGDSRVQRVRDLLSERLLRAFQQSSEPGWRWFEGSVGRESARLSQALLATGARLEREDMMTAGLQSLAWLDELQRTPLGTFAPLGADLALPKGAGRGAAEQRPLEVSAMVCASLEASALLGEAEWRSRAQRAFAWFLGANHLQASLFDRSTGGCCDGLLAECVDEHQSAESTVAFLLALLAMRAEEPTTSGSGKPLLRP